MGGEEGEEGARRCGGEVRMLVIGRKEKVERIHKEISISEGWVFGERRA
jgi:hypothetical protein